MLKKINEKIKKYYLNEYNVLTKYEENKINMLGIRYKSHKKIFLLSTPEHGNLGDHAIAIAIKKILEDKYPETLILEISFNEYNRNKKLIEKYITPEDELYLIGGGNFGNLYIWEEEQRRDLINRFIKNKITIMPQSIFYTNDIIGKNELEKTKKILNKHNKLKILTRDEQSYNFALKEFSLNKIILIPDSVLYLEDYYNYSLKKRNGVIFTLRKDKEKILEDQKINEIKNFLKTKKIQFESTDTTVDYKISKETREYEVNSILKKIRSSKLNITDRFHGLIFSIITNTPVIVYKSLDHKIEKGMNWFQHLHYVHYCTQETEVENIIKKYVENDIKIIKNKFEFKEIFRKKIIGE